MQVEHMPTMKLLIEPCRHHLFSADDTDAITPCQIICRCIWEPVHARCDLPEAQEVRYSVAEVAECHVQVPNLQDDVFKQKRVVSGSTCCIAICLEAPPATAHEMPGCIDITGEAAELGCDNRCLHQSTAALCDCWPALSNSQSHQPCSNRQSVNQLLLMTVLACECICC